MTPISTIFTGKFFLLLLAVADSLVLYMHGTGPRAPPEVTKRGALEVGSRAALMIGGVIGAASSRASAKLAPALLVVEPLSYSFSALEPYLDRQTMEIHHDRHYGKYVANAQSLVKGSSLEGASLDAIMADAYKSQSPLSQGLYNNAAQAYNHAFYWKSMSPSGGGEPKAGSKVAKGIVKGFGDYASFRKEFVGAGLGVFGSGWVWAVLNKRTNAVEVIKTTGAENPLNTRAGNVVPLFTMDVWEHAYYLKYQNRRNEYVEAFLSNLVNWEFAEQNMV